MPLKNLNFKSWNTMELDVILVWSGMTGVIPPGKGNLIYIKANGGVGV
jgi:hypothetical protein